MAKADDAQNPSMEQILQTIRGVISGEDNAAGQEAANDEVLELTEMVEEDGSITSLKVKPAETPSAESRSNTVSSSDLATQGAADVLANIDNALKEDVPVQQDGISGAPVEVQDSTPDTEEAVISPPELGEAEAPKQKNTKGQESGLTAYSGGQADVFEPSQETIAGKGGSEMISNPDAPVVDSSPKSSTLISKQAAAASTKALTALLHNLPKPKVDTPSFQSGMTLEELVVEALKPELSAWLDKNLPTLVTHIVEKEIRKLLPDPE